MAYQIRWDNASKKILHQIYSGTVTIEDYYQAVKEAAQLLSEVPHPVDLIMDVRDAKIDLKGFVTATQYANRLVPPNQRLVVGVGVNGVVRATVSIAKTFAPKATNNLCFVDTLEEAYQLIHAYQDDVDNSDEHQNKRG